MLYEVITAVHTGFGISSYEEVITLASPMGLILDQVTVSESQADIAYARVFGEGVYTDEWAATSSPSPGYPNTDDGYQQFLAANPLAVITSYSIHYTKLYDVSVGDNSFGHPHARALKNLEDYSEEVYTTMHDHAVLFFLNDTITVKTYGGYRITSYNVCYTKLLRTASAGSGGGRGAA